MFSHLFGIFNYSYRNQMGFVEVICRAVPVQMVAMVWEKSMFGV